MRTFSIGGVHPHDNKLSAGVAIESLPLPEHAVIPLSQHIGAPAVPNVKKGDVVERGQMLATPAEGLSVAVHASIDGKIIEVTEKYVIIEK